MNPKTAVFVVLIWTAAVLGTALPDDESVQDDDEDRKTLDMQTQTQSDIELLLYLESLARDGKLNLVDMSGKHDPHGVTGSGVTGIEVTENPVGNDEVDHVMLDGPNWVLLYFLPIMLAIAIAIAIYVYCHRRLYTRSVTLEPKVTNDMDVEANALDSYRAMALNI